MTTLQLLSILISIAALFGWISARWLKLPTTIGTMLLTVLCSLALITIGAYTPGLQLWAFRLVQQINFEALILHGMLSLLLFAGAFLLDIEHLFHERLSIAVLSVAGTVLSTIAVAALMYWALPLLGLPATWLECLFFGALISPTDPIAVLEMLRRVGMPKYIQAQLAGESLFNDGVAAVIFLTLLDAYRGATPSAGSLALSLALKAGGGILLGVVAAWIISSLMRLVDAYQVDILLTLALALGGYALADTLRISAPLEAVAAAISLRRFNQRPSPMPIAHESIDHFWEVIDEVQNAVLFVLLGLEILAIPFHKLSLEAGLVAILAVNSVRLAVVALLLSLIRLFHRSHQSSLLILSWGGLRGGLSIALALSVPATQGRSWILATTYIVVVFSIVFQGGSLDVILRRRHKKLAQYS
ncbi:sodium/proton antiporter (CPA1 family) [Edaphobacter aggregans]|uniref:Sodium/proton antiporter (CPA1 family) n=1 Tax=Edaphobacter aggregans TaxID=570835 RepID=A0A3R9NVV4_9BACT|nr:sodium:proton antiporter [Edaphobacter aggregans]RSL15796.1 sodium/proton antiporter (CPA1 family) [Edaphobacter aggregans]